MRNQTNRLGGQLALRPEQPPSHYIGILGGCLGLHHLGKDLIKNSTCLPGGCSGLRPRPPPFCVKSAGAAKAGGPLRPLTPGKPKLDAHWKQSSEPCSFLSYCFKSQGFKRCNGSCLIRIRFNDSLEIVNRSFCMWRQKRFWSFR